MSQHDRPPADGESSGPFPYVHGSGPTEQQRLERRTAAAAAAFFLPHLRPGMRLLDCGCGVGSITLGLAAAVAPAAVVGLDLQPVQIERARALAAARGVRNVRFEVGSVYALPLPDASVEAVFAHTLLLHLREPLRALGEMRRVLTPGGVVGIADADLGTLLSEPERPLITELYRLFWKAIRHHGGDPCFGRRERRVLLDAGFARPIASPTLETAGAHGSPEETREFAAWVVGQSRQPAFVALVTARGWADEATLDAMAAEFLDWGERPDAYHAAMGVAAVGWLDG
jgi:ubiquinone/menaquinone biosynthesis C-methylase UbiE